MIISILSHVNFYRYRYIGLSAIQVRRFNRIWNEIRKENEPPAKESTNLQQGMSSKSSESSSESKTMYGLKILKNTKPWEDKTFGFIPKPVSDRALFMNSVLPTYYKSQWKFSKNTKEFVKGFHTEGRRQYDVTKQIDALNDAYSSIISDKKPYASFITGEKALKPTDAQTIKYGITCLNQLEIKVRLLKTKISEDDNEHFTKLGKVKSGHECAHKFQQNSITSLIDLLKKIEKSVGELETVLKKHRQMFPFAKEAYTSKKRRQKENKAKSKKRKLDRKTKNCSQLMKDIILLEHDKLINITSEMLNVNVIKSVSKKNAKWLKLIIKEEKFSTEAVKTIRKLLKDDICSLVFDSDDSGDDTGESSDSDNDSDIIDSYDI